MYSKVTIREREDEKDERPELDRQPPDSQALPPSAPPFASLETSRSAF